MACAVFLQHRYEIAVVFIKFDGADRSAAVGCTAVIFENILGDLRLIVV